MRSIFMCLCDEIFYPGYKSRYDRFPPTANGWGAKYPVLDMVPPFLAEEERPPT
jgi:hypothetical protein